MPRLKESQYEKIIEDYLSGMTQLETAKANGVGRDAVGKILKRFEVPTRDYTGSRSDAMRNWYWDFEFFSRRNPTVAYWAGFSMADGSISKVSKNSYNFCLCIHRDDTDHLKDFCNDIQLPWESVHIRKTGEADVRLNHPDLAEQLEPWGIVPRKTYNFVEPEVSIKLLPHYLRGWADGDGHIYRYGRGARFTVSGNPDAMEWYAEALKFLGFIGHIGFQKRSDNCWVLGCGGIHNVDHIVELLLVDSEFCLKRKWNKSYTAKRTLYDVECANCGKIFGVPKFRYEHPTQGRFCGRECSNEGAKKPVIDEKRQCAKCEEWVLLEDYSANPSYCKVCWRKI